MASAPRPVLSPLALGVAGVDALAFPLVRFSDVLDPGVVVALMGASAGALALMFLTAVLDRDVRRAVGAANRELQGERPFRFVPLLDPTWGVFGARLGDRPLTAVRTVLFAEFLVGLLTAGRDPGPGHTALQLAMLGFGLTIVLSLVQLTRHYPEGAASG